MSHRDEHYFTDSLEEAKRLLDMVDDYSGPLAVDCEGQNLGRHGTIGLVQIAIPGCAFIFDVQEIGGEQLFDVKGVLRRLLEDDQRVKVFFDCRQDCDALQHHFNVRVRNIRDLQIAEVLLRDLDDELEEHRLLKSFIHHGSLRGQPQNYKHVVKLKGLKQVLKEYDLDEAATAKGARVDHDAWCQRPLSPMQKEYAFGDVIGIRDLFEMMHSDLDGDDSKLRVASEKFADTIQTLTELPGSLYLNHPLLPLCVIPEVPPVPSAYPTVQCPMCFRVLPKSIFSKAKQKTKQFRCDVCRAIDVQESVLVTFARNQSDSDAYEYEGYESDLYGSD